MELRRYMRILLRRWWVIVALTVLVGVFSLLTYRPPAPVYTATMRFNVGLVPQELAADVYTYDHYYAWLSSEYLMDDLASAVRGGVFAQRVQARLGEGAPSPAGAISSATEHRVLTVSITWGNAEELAALANAAVAVLQEEAADFVGPIGTAKPVLRLIDPPVVVPVGPSLKARLDLPLRVALALLAGVAVAFVWDYVDPTVRERAELESLGLVVLGEIPRR